MSLAPDHMGQSIEIPGSERFFVFRDLDFARFATFLAFFEVVRCGDTTRFSRRRAAALENSPRPYFRRSAAKKAADLPLRSLAIGFDGKRKIILQ